MRWTQQEYDAYLARCSQVGVKLCPGWSEQTQTDALDGPVSGEAKSVQRIGVRVVFYRFRLWHDRDNYSSAAKDLLDGLRHAALIPGDSEKEIDLEVEQHKVANRLDQKTVIEIIW